MHRNIGLLFDTCTVISFQPERSMELLQLLAELERVRENTFQTAEKIVFLRTVVSYLIKVDSPVKVFRLL